MVGVVTHAFSNAVADGADPSVVRPSNWNEAHVQAMTVLGNTLGQSTMSGTNLVLAAISGVSLSLAGLTASIVGPDLAPYALSQHSHGNPTLALTNLSGTTASNSAGLTLSLSAAAGGGGADGYNILAAGTQTAGTAATVNFANSNGITFGMSQSSQITASHNGLTSQSNQNVTAANGGFAFQTLSFSNANGVSFGTSAGSAITASHNGLTSQSNQAFSAAGGSSAFQTLGFSDTNGVSFSNSNGSVVATVRTDYASSVHGHTATLLATSNTTQSSSGTANLNNLIFAGAGIASVGVTNGSVVVSVPSGGGAGDGGVFAGVSNLGNTAGSTGTVSTGNFVLVGTNGLSLSQSTGAAGSAATVTVYQAPPLSDLVLAPAIQMRATTQIGPPQNTMILQPFVVPHDLSATVIGWPVAISNSSSAVSSGQVGFTAKIAIYSQHSTDNKRLTLHSSTSVTLSASYSSNVSMQIGYFSSVVNSTSFGTSSSSSAGVNVSSLLHGDRMLMVPCGSLSVGNWWIGYAQSTSAAGTAGNVLVVQRQGFTSQSAPMPGVPGTATSASGLWNAMGWGPWSGNASTIPGSLSFSEVQQAAISMMPYFAIGTARR